MIERNLRDLTIRKFGTAFLEAFGMLPITYFGAKGDNVTDNYANIQVAISESIKRNLNFIFVPAGNYYYTGTFQGLDKVTFIGNGDAKIFTTEDTELEIFQIGTQAPWKYGTEHESVLLPDEPDSVYSDDSDISTQDDDWTESTDSELNSGSGSSSSGSAGHNPTDGSATITGTYVDFIKVPVTRPTEAYITVGNDVYYIAGTGDNALILKNGNHVSAPNTIVSEGATLTHLSLVKGKIQIRCTYQQGATLIDFNLGWRCR